MAIDINIPSQVKNYANLAAFPATGTLKTIFIAEDTNKTYRWTGSAYVEISPAGATGITIGTTAINSGTVGRLMFQGAGNVVQQSANITWDNTNSIFDVNGNIRISKSTYSSILAFNSGAFGSTSSYFDLAYPINGGLRYIPNFGASFDGAAFQCFGGTEPFYAGQMYFDYGSQARNISGRSANWRNASLAGVTNVLTLTANSNVLINTTTDAGFKVDINGTTRLKGTGTTSATVAFTVENSAGSKSLIIKDDASVFLGDSITNGTGLDALNQRPQRLYTYGNGQVGHYISSTVNAGTGDTSLGLFGLGTGGGYFGGVRVFTSSDSNTPILAMIVDRNQSVGIGLTNSTNLTVNASAKVQIDSTTKGFLPPRMTTTQKNAIATPATGLMVYDTTLNLLALYNGTIWTTL
jgi:hypothetical protein